LCPAASVDAAFWLLLLLVQHYILLLPQHWLLLALRVCSIDCLRLQLLISAVVQHY
jgi:hypothetical protein